MKTLASVIILTVAFLSAGAFAKTEAVAQKKPNITIVFKSNAVTEKDQSRIDACAIATCISI